MPGESVCNRTGRKLPRWADQAEASNIRELRTFTAGLRKDWAAVTAGLTLPYSSGAVEGHVNRIKMIKRQMYGRAKPDLLRNASCSPTDGRHGKWARATLPWPRTRGVLSATLGIEATLGARSAPVTNRMSNEARVRVTAASLLAALAIALIGLFTATAANAADTNGHDRHCGILKLGSVGPCVRGLQQQLNSQGATPRLRIDGQFEAKTRYAVESFQRRHSLLIDGIVGKTTSQALIAASITAKGGANIASRIWRAAMSSNAVILELIASVTFITVTAMTFRFLVRILGSPNVKRVQFHSGNGSLTAGIEHYPPASISEPFIRGQVASKYLEACGTASDPNPRVARGVDLQGCC